MTGTAVADAPGRSGSRLAVLGLYAGGFLGPFGGGVVASMLPELGTAFAVSPGTASLSLTSYMIPFAGLMLFSGTLGERWGARRTVRVAYLVYVLASVVCAVAATSTVFLAGRAVQGAANAFTTPLLLAALAAVTPRERLGRTLGLFASLQAAGQTTAPLVGGLAAEADWRWAFAGVAVVAGLLAVLGLPDTTRPAPSAHGDQRERAPGATARLRTAWRPAVLRVGLVALTGWGCLGGLSFLVAMRLDDHFGLGAGERGLLLTGYGVAALLTARAVGRAVDRVGPRRCVLLGTAAGAVLLVGVGLVPWLPVVAVGWAAAGVATQLILVGLNTLVLSAAAGNRGGAVSVVQAFRFLGGALAPTAFVPAYALHPAVAFLVPAVVVAVTAPAALPHQEKLHQR
ncbi:MFS transporter [Streptoalloteichus hindustanus]|uniref:Predicted arabinose efflux permease, MFS family n=1 Tax=Streptoalloteichus hindustanus TaxID=2017 RepID=A0A1M4YF22_STRHI|nr:MFS transporter [Streptoalloteichus hindustanus]SHF04387.1 Predicted arabinose efflux permease, MFS family [Streptoalloteichus hindustanus]